MATPGIDLRSDTVTLAQPGDAAGDGRGRARRRRVRRRPHRAAAGSAGRREAGQGGGAVRAQRHAWATWSPCSPTAGAATRSSSAPRRIFSMPRPGARRRWAASPTAPLPNQARRHAGPGRRGRRDPPGGRALPANGADLHREHAEPLRRRAAPPEYMAALGALARAHDLPLHLDGARIFNAAMACGRAGRRAGRARRPR